MRAEFPELTLGIEEEYLLVDKETGALVTDPPDGLLTDCQNVAPGQVSPEFLRSQIEVGTKVCRSLAEAREDLGRLRDTIIRITGEYGLAPIAASSHPFGQWWQQKHTDGVRYNALAAEMQTAARRLVICGMHVHVGVPEDNMRIDLLNQLSYFLPHMLALSTSSPFWDGRNTGLKSYRLTVFDALPRTGLPERFASYAEYCRHVDVLTQAGLIEDASKIWWDMRPSVRFPTLEMRVTDVCTRLDDAVAIAALYACLVRMMYRLRAHNQRWRIYSPMLIRENRWRAVRYGFDAGMVDLAKGSVTDFDELLDELLDLVAEDAEALNCVPEVTSLRNILTRGSSAHQQVACFEQAISEGADEHTALRYVVQHLVEETRAHQVTVD
ncbi:MAG: carboxylate-amine ligase [Pseudomonadota bacterium]